MIKNFFAKLNAFFNGGLKQPIYRGTGALKDEVDYRDISLGSVQAPLSSLPKSHPGLTEIIEKMPVYDQGYTGSCVPHAIAALLTAYVYKKTGKQVAISPRKAYAICKVLDAHPGMGTYPRIGAIVATKYGFRQEKFFDDVLAEGRLTEEEYLNVQLTIEELEAMKLNTLPGFAYVSPTLDAVKDAIVQNGAVTAATIVGDWGKLPLKPVKAGPSHYSLWYSYEANGDGTTTIYTRNSWGRGWLAWLKNWFYPGDGYFIWEQYAGYVDSIIAFTDIPADFLGRVIALPYRFTQSLSLGMNHPDVRELQKLLNKDPETAVSQEGFGSAFNETTYFGPATKLGVMKWQAKHGITPVTGLFGPKSIAKANERVANQSRLRDWALAIQRHEGYFPNSRSYRNKNPGNIRYSGVFASMATGKDDKNFCVFATYEKGIEALETLLLRAAKGLSSIYKPDDTLTQFYGKYAPDSDGNNSNEYANAVAKALNVPVTTKIKDLV